MLTRDRELWAMALHVEREHGEDGQAFIVAQMERNRLLGEQAGIDLWAGVARRFEQLQRSADGGFLDHKAAD